MRLSLLEWLLPQLDWDHSFRLSISLAFELHQIELCLCRSTKQWKIAKSHLIMKCLLLCNRIVYLEILRNKKYILIYNL